jgi:hypothetical protein
MRRSPGVLPIILVMILVWTSGCSILSFGRQEVGGFGNVGEMQTGQPLTMSPVQSHAGGDAEPVPMFVEPASCEKILACYPPAPSGLITQTSCQESGSRENPPHDRVTSMEYGALDKDGYFIPQMSCMVTDTGTYVPEYIITTIVFKKYRDQIPMQIQGYPGVEWIGSGPSKIHHFAVAVHTRFLVGCGWGRSDIDETFSRDESLQFTNSFNFPCFEALV